MFPHRLPPRYPEPLRDSRFATTFRTESPEGCRVALLGLPDEVGVALNGGRPGASQGPAAIRDALSRYGAVECDHDWPAVFDAGDVEPGETIDETHGRITAAVEALLARDLFPVGLGGGHDLTYPFVRALATRLPGMWGVYFDAHLDVREETGSGMPFRALVERCGVSGLRVHGLDCYANSRDHLDWFREHNGKIDAFGPEDAWPEEELFVSLDLDVLDQAYAPGVSATNPSGWSPRLAERWCLAAGRNPNVRCFDLMELSPPHDEAGRTARLAARLLLTFLRGFAERPA